MAADGSIRIVTKIDITDAKLKLKQLQQELARADKAIETAQKNLAKNASKMAAYNAEKQAITESTNFELSRAETEEQVNNVLAIEQAQLEALNQKYASVLERQRQQEAILEEARRTQAGLTTQVQEQQGVVRSLTVEQERQAQEVRETAQAEREHARAVKETERASNKLARSADRVSRKIRLWGTAMLGVRGVIGILRKSVNAFLNDNENVANQIASVWSVLGNILAPIITRIVNLISTAVSIVAAFIKALTGIDIVANANAKALENQAGATASAGSAAEEAEKQLAGFDEMNKLSDTSTSSGGGGGGSSADVANLFEAVQLSDKLMAQIQWVADHFKDILWYAGAIAAALLTWKIASAFGAGLKTTIGLMMAIAGAVVLVKGYIDAWQNGLDLQNMIEMFGGLLAVVVGLGIAFGPVAAAIAALVGGLAMLSVGLKDWITTGELSAETCATLSTAILLIGGAISVLTGSFIPLIIAAIIAAVLTIIAYWDEIKEAWQAVKEFIVEKWEALTSKINEFFSKIAEAVATWAKNVRETISTWASNAKAKIQDLIATGKAKFEEFKTNVVAKFQTIKQKVSDVFQNVKQTITDAIENAKSKFNDLKEKVLSVWETVKSKFTSLGSVIGSAISGAIKTAINNVLSLVESKINSAVSLINSAISLINKLPGVSVNYLSSVSLPRLAKGGVVNNPGRGVPAVIGEAGAEAVLPLERNTEWMDILADKINSNGGQVTIPIYLSGKQIAKYVVDLNKRTAFATNNA